jgi:hypothetical protein
MGKRILPHSSSPVLAPALPPSTPLALSCPASPDSAGRVGPCPAMATCDDLVLVNGRDRFAPHETCSTIRNDGVT